MDTGRKFGIETIKYGTPTQYLGAQVQILQTDGGQFSGLVNLTSKVPLTLWRILAGDGHQLQKYGKQSYKGPLLPGYNPELIKTPELKAEYVSKLIHIP